MLIDDNNKIFCTDSGNWNSSRWQTITNARHHIEFSWRAATAPDISNGRLGLWINGVRKADLTRVDDDTHREDQIRFGPAGSIDAGTRGKYFLDDLVSRRDNQAIGP